MADDSSTPVSPPLATAPPGAPTFEHKTSPGTSTQMPLIDTRTPAINSTPIELDGEPTSPAEVAKQAAIAGQDGDKAAMGIESGGRGRKGSLVVSPGLGEEEEIAREFLGEKGLVGVAEEVRVKRAAFLASRSKDPGVIVDLPSFPTAEEVEAAKSAEGVSTPGLGQKPS